MAYQNVELLHEVHGRRVDLRQETHGEDDREAEDHPVHNIPKHATLTPSEHT